MWHYNVRRFSTDTIKKYYRRMNLYKIWYLLVMVCIMKVLLINCFVQIVLFTYSQCSNLHRPQSPCYSFENTFFPTLKTVMCCFIHFLISMGVGYIFRQSPQQLEHLYIKTVVFVGKIVCDIFTVVEKHILGNYVVSEHIFYTKAWHSIYCLFTAVCSSGCLCDVQTKVIG